jgi:hypothetical protein
MIGHLSNLARSLQISKRREKKKEGEDKVYHDLTTTPPLARATSIDQPRQAAFNTFKEVGV